MRKTKTIWITGASSGLGWDIALEAGRKGYRTVLLARNTKKLHQLQNLIEELGGEVFTYSLDVSDPEMITKVTEHVMTEVGQIDVLINNAGFGVFERVESTNIKTVEEMFAVNVIGLIALTKQVLPYLIKQNSGHIINIASQAGKLSTPKSSVYAATKHAVLGFTNGLRLELLDQNVHVSAVNPGPIKTAFFERADQEGTYVKNVERWMLDSKEVAKATIRLIEKPKRELNLPKWMNMGATLYQLMPGVVEKIAGKKFNQK
ncbi:SDR family NAD(P)-dependent oxidoreductase [Alkalihalobacillus deserti]|uniref:SDR family NAD(P)-dependent oxidoreductase n=1 Tax=Alkalihalobacillus deserti TaxID=2879466 RepID=UPI001D134839|nr:SDR family oxidoreductase [Alkalihalobacillus deserti]